MRRLLFTLPLLVACAGSDTPPADSAAPAMAMISEADVAGTWTGTATMEGSDSVVLHWTQVCNGGTCRGTSQEQPGDTVVATYTIAGDSAVGVSAPYVDKSMGGITVIDNWVSRPSGSQVTGYGWAKLADKDSVVARIRFTGTKAP